MPVFEIDPRQDSRWTSFLESHPWSSIFHTREWLEALHRTYGFAPRAFTTSQAGEPLTNAIVFCQINSWLTGSKLVSLPFSDHCEPLVENPAELQVLLSGIGEKTTARFKYVEIRPRRIAFESPDWAPSDQFHFHALDLHPSLDELYSRLHKDGVQRKIRRAEREHVVLEQGRSDVLVQQFYQLLLLTRRRHRLPPQPLAWFRNLVACLGTRLTIHLARIGERPIASILTLQHKQALVYKYGCSDERFHNLGGMPAIFWQAIQQAKSQRLEELDLGRSDEDNSGLVRFKNHLGATKTSICYWQTPPKTHTQTGNVKGLNSRLVQSVFLHLPDRLFRLAGEIFYRHAG